MAAGPRRSKEAAAIAKGTRAMGSMNWFWYLNQKVWWYPDGKPRVEIEKDMTDSWRVNAAKCLLRWSPKLVVAYQLDEMAYLLNGAGGIWREVIGEDKNHRPIIGGPANMLPQGELAQEEFERTQEWQLDHPEEWIRQMPLFIALIEELGVEL